MNLVRPGDLRSRSTLVIELLREEVNRRRRLLEFLSSPHPLWKDEAPRNWR